MKNKETIMKKHIAVLGAVLAVFFFAVCQNVYAEDPVKDAKAAFTKFVKAAKAKNTAEAKKYIAKDALKELEKDGMLDMFLEVQADTNPNAAKAEVKGNRVILKIDEKKTTKDGSYSTSFTAYMVKEDGQWKLGKPEGKK